MSDPTCPSCGHTMRANGVTLHYGHGRSRFMPYKHGPSHVCPNCGESRDVNPKEKN